MQEPVNGDLEIILSFLRLDLLSLSSPLPLPPRIFSYDKQHLTLVLSLHPLRHG